jgi:large subunit ribosomal protein L34
MRARILSRCRLTLLSDAHHVRDGSPYRFGHIDARTITMPKGKRTYQPNNRRRARRHGFRLRMRTRAGRAIVKARRRKGRRRLTA